MYLYPNNTVECQFPFYPSLSMSFQPNTYYNNIYCIPIIQSYTLPIYQTNYQNDETKEIDLQAQNNLTHKQYVLPEIDQHKKDHEKTKLLKKKFTKEEDEKLKELVNKMGAKRWNSIAKHIPGRNGRQCRDRYQNYLIPGFFNGHWSLEEDELLLQKYKEFGSQWSKMTKFFRNRNANSLKNRWNYFVSKHLTDLSEYRAKKCINNEAEELVNEEKNFQNDELFENNLNYSFSQSLFDLDPTIGREEYI